jgi:hypothetical protein
MVMYDLPRYALGSSPKLGPTCKALGLRIYSTNTNIRIFMVIVKVVVFLCSGPLASFGFVADTDVSEAHADSIFRVDVCRFRNRLITSSPCDSRPYFL